MTTLREALAAHTGNSRRVLEYAATTKACVDAAKQPGASAQSWNPLRDLLAVDEFERVGNFKEVMDWDAYLGFLTNWAPSAEWDCTFKRVTEVGDLVFLELEERSAMGDFTSVVNSMTLFEFNAAGKIRHIDVYLQMEMLSPDLLKGYEGVEISQ